jgi:hypothetical protein
MRLYEFANSDPQVTSLIAISNQLKDAIDSGQADDNWTVDELLQYFHEYSINLSPGDLRKMITQPPLNNVISNIKGDQVVFVGQDSGSAETDDQDQNQEVVAQMAKSAMPTK